MKLTSWLISVTALEIALHYKHVCNFWASQVVLVVKNSPMQETQKQWVQSLGRGDPLEEEMATHSSILAWRILWTEETDRL